MRQRIKAGDGDCAAGQGVVEVSDIAAPYPADTSSKGWRFELDMARVRTSDTWALTPADMRPWLLMLWVTAWDQTPCGSLPSDGALIAAHIGMPAKTFAKHSNVLLRGWWLAADGRLYHSTIVERVHEMNGRKRKERDRKAAYRHRADAEQPPPDGRVPVVSRGTDAGQTRDSRGNPAESDTGTGTGTEEEIHTHTEIPPSEEEKACNPPVAAPAARKRKSAATAKQPLPDHWFPKPTDVARLAAELGLQPTVVEVTYADAFRDACAAHGYVYLNHDAAFRNCVRGDWPKLRSHANGTSSSSGAAAPKKPWGEAL